ncbi:type I-E CRISPR-associated protein Cas6/Cse3/CasE, partial [Lactobacillus salivarius]
DNISSNESFEIVKRDKVILKKGSKNIKLSRVSFEGLLEITDVDLFRKVLIDGIGKEKAFGMGLMTVIPRR